MPADFFRKNQTAAHGAMPERSDPVTNGGPADSPRAGGLGIHGRMPCLSLIGMPGSGKSTLGVLLAKALCCDFVDTDLIIQKQQHRPLQQILDQDGLEAFLHCEAAAILSLQPCPVRSVNKSDTDCLPWDGCVIATGGSAILSEKAMTYLRGFGPVIYLEVSLGEIEKRLWNIHTRGIVMPAGQTIADLYEQRRPLYERYADLIVQADRLDVERLIEQIVAWQSEWRSADPITSCS